MKLYIEQYKQLCSQFDDGTTKKAIKSYNKIMDKLNALEREIRNLDEDTIIEIADILLNDPDKTVRVNAAAFCVVAGLRIHKPKVLQVFQEVKPNDPSYLVGTVAHFKFCIKMGEYDF